jgi:hypothetical protein
MLLKLRLTHIFLKPTDNDEEEWENIVPLSWGGNGESLMCIHYTEQCKRTI